MAVTQYVGARYVPLFADPLEWANTRTYEPLTIVQHEGNSYTSRQYVPAGIDISNEDYWALTGNYNAQIEQYRQEVQAFDSRITAAQNAAATAQTTAEDAQTTAEDAQTSADSKAPFSHASADTTYGAGSDALYGHVKLADALSDSAASAGIAASPKMVNDVNDALNANVSGKAPISHASAETTYGAGSDALFGHVKLADALSDSAASAGIAASPKMVNDVNDALSAAQSDFDSKLSALGVATMLEITPGENVSAVSSQFGTCTLFKQLGIMILNCYFTTNASIPSGEALFTIGATKAQSNDVRQSISFIDEGTRNIQNGRVDTDGSFKSYAVIGTGQRVEVSAVVPVRAWGGDYAPDPTGAN